MQVTDCLQTCGYWLEIIKISSTLLAVYLGVNWTLKRIIREKRWERKSDAYLKIIESLHYIKKSTIEHLDDELDEKTLTEERSKELRVIYSRSLEDLEKYIDIGSYIISNEAVAALDKLKKIHQACIQKWKFDDPFLPDLYQDELTAVNEALTVIKHIAERELK